MQTPGGTVTPASGNWKRRTLTVSSRRLPIKKAGTAGTGCLRIYEVLPGRIPYRREARTEAVEWRRNRGPQFTLAMDHAQGRLKRSWREASLKQLMGCPYLHRHLLCPFKNGQLEVWGISSPRGEVKRILILTAVVHPGGIWKNWRQKHGKDWM